MLKQAKRRV